MAATVYPQGNSVDKASIVQFGWIFFYGENLVQFRQFSWNNTQGIPHLSTNDRGQTLFFGWPVVELLAQARTIGRLIFLN